MEERGITEEQVELAIARHIGPAEPGSSPGSIEFVGPPMAGKCLKVVCSAVDTDVVITMYLVEMRGGSRR